MSAQHTPGPWHYTAEADGSFEICIANGAWLLHCMSASNPTDAERLEDEANVRLAAAAPALLSIARRWAAIDGGSWHIERHAREKAELLAETDAVIAKATGQADQGSETK